MDIKNESALRYDSDKVRFSLLPHDILQLIIDRDTKTSQMMTLDRIIPNSESHVDIVTYLSRNIFYFWQNKNADEYEIINLTHEFIVYIAYRTSTNIYKIFLEVANVLEFGARKYDVDNWKKGFAFSRIYNSLMRHLLLDFNNIDSIDPESGLKTYSHILCNLFFLIWHLIHRSDLDDRPEE